jgi:hypothetical protein
VFKRRRNSVSKVIKTNEEFSLPEIKIRNKHLQKLMVKKKQEGAGDE